MQVDYLKYDNCYNEGQSGTPQITYNRYNTMSKALNATGRYILYSMCNWGEDSPWNVSRSRCSLFDVCWPRADQYFLSGAQP